RVLSSHGFAGAGDRIVTWHGWCVLRIGRTSCRGEKAQMRPQASARPHPRNRLLRLPLPAPLDGHTWPTVPSLLAASLALRGALDREAQHPFCDAPSRLWHVGVRDGVMDICCALHTAGFGFPLGTRWLNRDKLNGSSGSCVARSVFPKQARCTIWSWASSSIAT